MPRKPRIVYEDAIYHVMNRGAGKKIIYRDRDSYLTFLDLLNEIHQRYGVIILAYCLMSNHYHLLIRTPNANISRALKHLSSVFTMRQNKRFETDGPLFRGRFHSLLVQDIEYLLQASRYIHLNPVDAGICMKPEQYEWSSYRFYLSREFKADWLNCDEVLTSFSSENSIKDYYEFVEEGIRPFGV